MKPFAITFSIVLALSATAFAELRVGDICRVKGQEENTLQGLGLVVGLNGTGDAETPTIRALSRTLELMGNSIAKDFKGRPLLDELKKTKNVALVFVTATVPAEGARQGDKLDCSVNAISAKSIQGGYLMMTPLLGPRPGEQRIYGFGQGPLTTEAGGPLTAAKVHGGCRLEENFHNEFVKDGTITLVLHKDHARFQRAQDIEDTINSRPDFRLNSGSGSQEIAKAKDPMNIVVKIPPSYADNPVQFVAAVLDQRIFNSQNDARVVINERDSVIVIGAGVEIGPVAVTHKNLTIEAGPTLASKFVPLDPANSSTKLKSLVDALNALKVPTDDIIDIIKGLEKSGDLYGKLIVQ